MQIQSDALMVNWERDEAKPDEYWHYEQRRTDFANRLGALDQFLGARRLGSVIPTTCFVTYLNHVPFEPGDEFATVLARVLPMWSNHTSDSWLPAVEMGQMRLSFALPDQRGRLHVNITPGQRRRDHRNILRLDLTARGTPQQETIASALDWLDLGHDWVVRGFASLTRTEMHEIWRRNQ